jgi:serine phosphatase RsbU (regulator of sigma subunit)
MHHLGWGGLTVFITTSLIGFFVYSKNPRKLFNKIWLVFCLAVAIFGFGFFKVDTSATKEAALFWWQFMYVGVIFIAVTFLHVNLEFLNISNRKALYFLYPINLCFLLIDLFSRAFFKSVTWKFSNIWYADAGNLFLYFVLIWWGTVAYALCLVYKEFRASRGVRHNQIKYWLLAFIVGFFGGIFCYLPIFNINFVYPYSIYLVAIWTVILFFAFVKYHLWEIDTVAHRTLLWILTSGLIFIPVATILYFIRPWLVTLGWLQLTLVTVLSFYAYLYYYHKLQPHIDHLFRRRKYDYQTILGKVAEKIVTSIDIEDLTRQLLNEVCEAMYLGNSVLYVLSKKEDKYSLAGRRGYGEADGIRQRTFLEVYNEEKRDNLPVEQRELGCDNPLCRWLIQHRDILEFQQVEIDPQYAQIKEETLVWFRKQELELVIPLVFESKVIAILGLGRKENLQSYNLKDLELLKKLGQEAGVTIFNALHYEDSLEKGRLEEEMKMGRQIQITLLPRQIPQINGLEVRGLMQPAKEIGGDYYDFISLPDKDRLAIVIGDVSGKGVAAGLLMAMAKTAIHTLSQEGNSPKEILLRTNQILHQHIGGQKFMTLLYMLWDPRSGSFTYSSAGHEHLLIYRANQGSAAGGVVEAIVSGGFMLGMMDDIGIYLEEKEIKLEPKDKILLYTDGVTEAEDQNRERFSLRRLKEAFIKHSQKPAQELMQAVKDDVYSFIGTHPQYDDITLVVMEATEKILD